MVNLHVYLLPFLTSLTFLLAGLQLFKFPPKKINGLYGYRTRRSMKNQKNWDYAQRMGGKLMVKFSVLNFVILSTLGYVLNNLMGHQVIIPVQLVAFIILCIGMLWRGEKELKAFDINSQD